MLWLLASLTAVASLCDGLTTSWTLSKYPEHVFETNPVIDRLVGRVSQPVFVAVVCVLTTACSLVLGLVAQRFEVGSIAQVVFLLVIAAAAVNNALILRRLGQQRSAGADTPPS